MLTKIRKNLHEYPELSGKEINTALLIQDLLEKYSPNRFLKNIGGHGITASFIGKNAGNHVLIRAELDALPIQEVNDFEHASTTKGVSHKCGHDGHMAILIGVANYFQKNPLEYGEFTLLFQPAEEIGEGAQAILSDEKWSSIQPDYVLALHNVPGFPMHAIVCKEGAFTPAVKSIIITLTGKTSHAAEPEKGINPALAVSKIIARAHEIEVNEYNEKLQLITPIQVELGDESYGISAGYAQLKFTLRAWDNEVLESLGKSFEKQVKEIGQSEKLEVAIEWTQFFAANINDKDIITEVRKAAQVNNLTIINQDLPFKWGEDFGLFTQTYKGALFGLGAGEDTPALHNPDYDFPDELIETGVKMFTQLILQLSKK